MLTAPATVSFAGLDQFVDSLFASSPKVPVQQRGHGPGHAVSTKAGVGSGHPPGVGAGQVGLKMPSPRAPVGGVSGTVHKGFDASTSVMDHSRSSAKATWYDNTDGSLTERISQQAVNYKDSSGKWQPIGTTLTREAGGRLGVVGGVAATFAPGSGAGAAETVQGMIQAVSLDASAPLNAGVVDSPLGQVADVSLADGGSVAWSLLGAQDVPAVVTGDTVSYPGVLPDTTLSLESLSDGVEESLVLSSAQAGNSWTFPLTLTGVSLVQNNGAWELVDGAGNQVAELDSPHASDSELLNAAGDTVTTNAVSYSLATVNGVEQLTMTLDQAWLDDPARVFPVTVDPSLSIPTSGAVSTYVDLAWPSQNYLTTDPTTLKVGYDPTPLVTRSYIMLPGSSFVSTGYHVTSSTFGVFQTGASNTGTQYGFSLYTPSSSWSPSTIDWNNQPASYYQNLGDWTGAGVTSTSCNGTAGQWDDISLTPSAINAVTTEPPGNYFGLVMIADNETNSNYYKHFMSSQVTGCGAVLLLTYTPDVQPQLDSYAPLTGTPVTTLTPQLIASGHDPDHFPAASVQYEFSVFDSTGAQIATSGFQASGIWGIPAGHLAWGKSYTWEVCVFDGFECQWAQNSANGPGYSFTTSAPSPVLTDNLSQDSDGHGFNAALGNYTTSATDAKVTVVGPALEVGRSYNSIDPRSSGAFGAGWSSALDSRAVQIDDASGSLLEVLVTYPDGSQVPFAANSNGTFAPPAGRYATLLGVKNGLGVFSGYTLTDKTGTVYTFGQSANASGAANPYGSTSPTTGYGTAYYLTSVTDHAGHVLSFAYTAGAGPSPNRDPLPSNLNTAVSFAVPEVTSETSSTSHRSLYFTWSLPSGSSYSHITGVSTDPASAGMASSAQMWTYAYSGDELTQVCAPSASGSWMTASTPSTACTGYSYEAGTDYQSAVEDSGASQYWPLSDASGATAAQTLSLADSGNGAGTAPYTNVSLGGAAHLAGSTATIAQLNGTSSVVSLPTGLVSGTTYTSVGLWFQTTGSGPLFSDQNQPLPGACAGVNSVDSCIVVSPLGPLPTAATTSLYVGTDGFLHGLWNTGGSTPLASTVKVNDGAWHFALLTGEGTTQSLYLDGAQVGSATGQIQNSGLTYDYVGGGYSMGTEPATAAAGNWYLPGSVSDVSVWSRGLTAQEAQGLYAAGASPGAHLTKVTRPNLASNSSEAPAASVAYSEASGRVTQVTDANGGVWGVSSPTASGAGVAYESALLGQQPQGYWPLIDPAGTTNPADLVNQDAWASSTTAALYNNVTLSPSTPTAQDPFNSGAGRASFNGTSSYVQLPSGMLGTVPETVSLWFQTTGTGEVLLSANQVPLAPGTLQLSAYTPLLYVGADGLLEAGVSSSAVASSLAPVNDGKWHQVLLSLSSTSQVLYIDGVQQATVSGKWTGASMSNSVVGAGVLGGGWPDLSVGGAQVLTHLSYFIGLISNVAVFRSALSGGQAVESQAWKADQNSQGSPAPLAAVTVTDPADTFDGSEHSELYEFDPASQLHLVRYTDGLGRATTYGYDANGFESTITNPNGNQEVIGHDVRGNQVSTTMCQYQALNDCSTSYTTYLPDDTTAILTNPGPTSDQIATESNGRSASAQDTTYRTSYTYDANGNVLTTTDPLGRVTTNTYTDGQNFPVCAAAGTGQAPAGLIASTKTPSGAITSYTYDAAGDVCTVTNADGLVTAMTYDGLGRLLTKTVTSDSFPAGLTTSYTYTAFGNIASTTEPATTDQITGITHTAATTMTYDNDGNPLVETVSDSTGGDAARTMSITYNNFDQKSVSLDAEQHTTSYTYDALGNVETETDPMGLANQYLYDAASQLRTTTQANTNSAGVATPGVNLVTDTKTYDAGGRVASDTDAMGFETTFTYYDNNLQYQATKWVTSTNSSGTTVTTPYIESESFYDGAGNVTRKLTNNNVTESDYVYNAAEQPTTSTLDPAGVDRSTAVTYTPDGKAAETVVKDGHGTVSDIQDSYDPTGNKTSETVIGASQTEGATTVSDGATGAWALNDGAGLVANDSSGNGNPATLSSVGATWSTAHGGSLSLDGASGYAQTSGPVVNTAQNYSVSAWVNLAATAGKNQTALAETGTAGTPSTAPAFALQYSAASNTWAFSQSQTNTATSTTVAASSTGTAAVGVWTHLVGVYTASSGAMQLYVNGVLAGTATNKTVFQAFGPLTIGGSPIAPLFDGQISGVRVYQRALTANDVFNLYASGTTAVNSAAPGDNPAGAWPLADLAGTQATDASGSGHPATVQGGVTWQPASATSLNLNGTSGYAQTSAAVVDTSASFTLSAWVDLASTSQDYQSIVAQMGSGSGAAELEYSATFGGFSFIMPKASGSATGLSAYDYASSKTGVAANTWVHLVGVYNSSTGAMQLYVNGTLAASATDTTAWAGSGPLVIGAQNGSAGPVDFTNGRIAQVRTYQTALTASAVNNLFDNGSMSGSVARLPAGATGAWPLNDGQGTVAQDTSGNSHPLTLIGGTTWATGHAASALFNGTTGYAQTSAAVVNPSESFSISAWVDLASTTQDWQGIAAQGGTEGLEYSPSFGGFTFYMLKASGVTGALGDFDYASTETGVAVGSWVHLVGVYNVASGAMTLYVNGTQAATATDSTPFVATGALSIGAGFNGQISGVRVYQRALTQSNVTSLYTSATTATVNLTTKWTLDERGLATSETNPAGATSYTVYDQAGQLVQTTSPAVTATTINPSTSAVTTVTGAVATKSTGYNTFGEAAETQDPDGNVTTTLYGADGETTGVCSPQYVPPAGGATSSSVGASTVCPAPTKTGAVVGLSTHQYNADGQQTIATDALDNSTQYTYDNLGKVASTTAANGGVTTSTYDADGDVLSHTGPTGQQTSATYDALGRKLTSTTVERYSAGTGNPASQADITTYTYQPTGAGLLLYDTSPDGVKGTSYTYDNLGETLTGTDNLGETTSYAYDGAGRVIKTTAPDGTYATATYDQAGQKTATDSYDASGTLLSSTAAAYNADGTVASTQDALNNTTTYAYDATGMLISQTQPVSATSSITVSFGYDLDGNQTAYTSGNGNAAGATVTAHTTYTQYNSWGLPETKFTPAATATNYASLPDRETTQSYDLDRDATAQALPGGVSLSSTYNQVGDMLTESGTGAAGATATRSFTYDDNGQVLSAGTSNTNTSGPSNATNESFTYDDRGDLSTAVGSGGASSFQYNGDGLMTSRTDTSGTTGYAYDTDDRLASLTLPSGAGGTTLSYAYTNNSLNYSVAYGNNGDTRSFSYNSQHQLASDSLATSTGTQIASIGYGYNADGQETGKTTTGLAGASANTYTYDEAGRLTSWANSSGTTSYTYDQDSNRTSIQSTMTGVASNVFTYDARDELTSGSVTGGAVSTYAYTANGDLSSQTTGTSGGNVTTNYTNDAFGQQVTAGSGTYSYDAAGRLITQTTGANTRTLAYSGAGKTVASDGANQYVQDPGGSLVATANPSAGTSSMLWTDQHTDVVGQFASTGTTLAGSQAYDPLGNILTTTGTASSLTVGYQSEWMDASTGHVNMGARWYSPATGQFMNKDTTSNSATPDSANANPFAYADGNPLTGTDPTGHQDQFNINVGGYQIVGTLQYALREGYIDDRTSKFNDWVKKKYGSGAVTTTLDGLLRQYFREKLQVQDDLNDPRPETGHIVFNAGGCRGTQDACVVGADNMQANADSALIDQYFATGDTVTYTANNAECGRVGINCTSGTKQVAFQPPGTWKDFIAGVGSAFASMVDSATDVVAPLLEPLTGWSASSAYNSWIQGQGIDTTSSLYDEGMGTGIITIAIVSAVAPEALGGDVAGATAIADGTASAGADVAAEGSGVASDVASTSSDLAPASELTESSGADAEAGSASDPSMCAAESFTAKTPVLMADGTTTPISQVKVGDQVEDSIPGQTGVSVHTVQNVITTYTDHDFADVTVKPVAPVATLPLSGPAAAAVGKAGFTRKVALTLAAGLVALAASTGIHANTRTSASATANPVEVSSSTASSGNVIHTTFLHPFYDETQASFVEAKNLHVGDILQTPTGTAEVTDLHLFHANTTTYDLTISGLHTFYVVGGSVPVLVHNDSCGIPGQETGQVAYGSTELSQETLQARALDGNRTNTYAAARYTDADGNTQTLVEHSNQFGHAEKNMLTRLGELGVDPDSVTDLYVEFQPCGDCAENYVPQFSNARVSWSFDWNTDPDVQLAAQTDRAAAIRDLWPPRT